MTGQADRRITAYAAVVSNAKRRLANADIRLHDGAVGSMRGCVPEAPLGVAGVISFFVLLKLVEHHTQRDIAGQVFS